MSKPAQKKMVERRKTDPTLQSRIDSQKFHPLDAITTIDGRYRDRVIGLVSESSERALIRTRVEIESKYIIALSEAGLIREITPKEKRFLSRFSSNFTFEDAFKVKEIEDSTNHDVKAVEMTFKELLAGTTLEDLARKVHMCLTSEDVNNIAYRLMLKRAVEKVVKSELIGILGTIVLFGEKGAENAMKARTHGQSAVGTTPAKEMSVFADRLDKEIDDLDSVKLTGKLNGAVGNYNTFKFAFPDVRYKQWKEFTAKFVTQFGLKPNHVTTQINTYEDMVKYMQGIQRINGVMVDFASDMWRYISDGWIKQRVIASEVGSSTMPNKVNPIDFENGEANLEMANDLIVGLSRRLQVSRLQRDLRDSTQVRNVAGLTLALMTVGLTSINKGLGKCEFNFDVIKEAINDDWSVLAEGAQTYLKANDEEIDDPYGLFKNATRGIKMTQREWVRAVSKMPISKTAKEEFRRMTPEAYIGFAPEIALETAQRIRAKRKISA